MLLKGKVVVVTGGGQGIGQGIVECAARDGARVAILDIRTERAKDLAKQLAARSLEVAVWQADVADAASFGEAIGNVAAKWGRIDALVNNAGVVAPPGSFMDGDPATWDHMIDVDYKGVLNGIRAAVPHLQRAGGGAIVNIGSDSARFGEVGIAVYSGCKGAVNSVSKSLAKELASARIRINVIAPGLIDTPIMDVARSTPEGAKMIEDTQKTIPLGKLGVPEDIGNLASFLVSDRASYITGQTISVNGGMIMFG
ncbi:2-hydroxycyclohexanecarboxyl-CoA dehydrogenase [Sphingobium faniae]|nr:2-hydroxycyclohexanecarboxyl-CoA dehydrogenase [Sphingobium faniae]